MNKKQITSKKYDIIMREGIADTIEANSEENAMEIFAINMDLDMNRYFRAISHSPKDIHNAFPDTKSIKIDCGFATIVAEINADSNYREICIGLEDKNGVWVQDIARIGQKYHYDEEGDILNEKGISVNVWSDAYDEDYTHAFNVNFFEDVSENADKREE